MPNERSTGVEMEPLTTREATTTTEGGDGASEKSSEDENPTGRVISNVNTYATLKTVVQGLMDTALFTSNASQMATLLKDRETDPFTHLEVARVTLLSFSMVFQVVIFALLVVQGATNIEKLEKDAEKRKKQEDMLKATNIAAIVFSMLVVLINIFVTKLE
ncbi:ninjurin-2-like isoform X2 [Branchiostoma lanceolatum]|uniref:ninjurin-2-like isoform X2 n=1 Tax=Branchiostoma lanceolatum TaxID=7740 RepID=UPI0034563D25